MTTHAPAGGGLIGQSVPRLEDPRLLTGQNRYVDDIPVTGVLEVAFVRSPHPHARIVSIDVTRARAVPGVIAVLTGVDLADGGVATLPAGPQMLMPDPSALSPTYTALSIDKVRMVGDPVVVVVAEDRYAAEDGCDAVEVEYELLEPVATAEHALDPERALVFEDLGSNVLIRNERVYGDPDAAFAGAHRVVRQTIRAHRVAHSPIETQGSLAIPDPGRGSITFYGSTQSSHRTRLDIAFALGLSMERIQVILPDMGGSFGGKGCTAREHLIVCHAARLLGRPVKWIEDRRENLLAAPQSRGETMEIAAAVDAEGLILALDVDVTLDQGAYPVMFPSLPNMVLGAIRTLMPGCNRIRDMRWQHRIVATNRAGATTYRGPWAIEPLGRETLTDRIAEELGIDPFVIRRRNLVSVEEQPYEMVTGPTIRDMDAIGALDGAQEATAGLREWRDAARSEGRLVGVGVSSFIEPAPGGAAQAAAQGVRFAPERATARIEPNGHVTVYSQQTDSGQSHETTLTQVAAEEFGVPLDHVRVQFGDTHTAPFGMQGTGAGRGAMLATGSVRMATRTLRRKVLEIASTMLEIAADDLEIVDGMVTPKGAPAKAIPVAQVAMMATMAAPPGEEPGLRSTEVFAIDRGAFAGGTHVCAVEIDRETGKVAVVKYHVTEQCGRVINPAVVEGQVRGAIAQGIGVALLEHAERDEDGNAVVSTFSDYLLPSAAEIPSIEIHHLDGELTDEHDFRAVGEGGTVAAPPAVLNAVADALGSHPEGGWELPLTPPRVLALIDAAGVSG